MQFKANGRSAFIIAVGLVALYAAPAQACDTSGCGRIVLAQNADPQAQTEAAAAPDPAATSDKPSRAKTQHAKKSSRVQKPQDKSGAKSSGASKTNSDKMSGADTTADQANGTSDTAPSAVAPWIANANAQMTGPATTAQELVKSLPEKTTDGTPSPTRPNAHAAMTPEPAATDQAQAIDDDSQVVASDQLNELDRAAATDQKPTSKILRPMSQTTHVANAGSEDAWSQTSLIGKIFIGFGGLLTLASAARMFIA